MDPVGGAVQILLSTPSIPKRLWRLVFRSFDRSRPMWYRLVEETANSVKLLGTCFLVPVLAAAAFFGPLLGITPNADVNGDRAVNVLDFQALVADTLAAGGRTGDLNADGAVNVLDLQRLLGRTGRARLPRKTEESSTSDEATPPNRLRAPVFAVAQTHLSAILFECRELSDAITCPDVEPGPVTHARQFLRKLTPHAPPLHA